MVDHTGFSQQYWDIGPVVPVTLRGTRSRRLRRLSSVTYLAGRNQDRDLGSLAPEDAPVTQNASLTAVCEGELN